MQENENLEGLQNCNKILNNEGLLLASLRIYFFARIDTCQVECLKFKCLRTFGEP